MLSIRRLFIDLLTGIMPTKNLARRVKRYLANPRLSFKHETSQPAYDKNIDIAFCFDDALWRQACATITSLLCNSRESCHYSIFCITDSRHNGKIRNVVKAQDKLSTVTFIKPKNEFSKAKLGSWPVSSTWRLELPNLLKLDKIFYADVDIIFVDNLVEADKIPLGDNLIAGVRDIREYINSGFLIMNLEQMRLGHTVSKLNGVLTKNSFSSPDQDALNLVCKNRILYIPWKYNFQTLLFEYKTIGARYSKEEFRELKKNPVVMHYSGNPKPWSEEYSRYRWLWKKYAAISGAFD